MFTKLPLTMQEKKIIEKLLTFYLKDRSKQAKQKRRIQKQANFSQRNKKKTHWSSRIVNRKKKSND